MAMLTVIQAAPLVGLSTQSLYRHIKQGKLSKTPDGFIDTAELIRCYGELKSVDSANGAIPVNLAIPMSQPETINREWFENQIELLQNEIKELKVETLDRERRLMDESLDREKRLVALLENKSSSESSVGGLFGKLFK